MAEGLCYQGVRFQSALDAMLIGKTWQELPGPLDRFRGASRRCWYLCVDRGHLWHTPKKSTRRACNRRIANTGLVVCALGSMSMVEKKKKVIFVGQGRLGNQVFQFVAAKKLLGGGLVLSPSLSRLPSVFDVSQELRLIFFARTSEIIIRRILVPLLMRPLFKWLRIGTYCAEKVEVMENGARGKSGRATVRKGLFQLAFVDGGYYQNLSDLLLPVDFGCLTIRVDRKSTRLNSSHSS